MVLESGSLFNPEIFGGGFQWIGQVSDDSEWRDNISCQKTDDANRAEGWGYRYKVRILGLHDKSEESIESSQLPWAQVQYPITSGSGGGGSSATSGILQGMFVYGFFKDYPSQNVPVITGILGNNAVTQLFQEIGTTVANFGPTSAYSEGSRPKTFRQKTIPPKNDLRTSKPKTPNRRKDELNLKSVGKGLLNELGLVKNIPATEEQTADAQNALQLGRDIGLSVEALNIFVKTKVHEGMLTRVNEANSPVARPQPGATIESADAPHLLNAEQVQQEDKYREKIVLSKCHDTTGSSMRAMQTIIDNLTQTIHKYTNSLEIDGYIDMVASKNPRIDLNVEIRKSSVEMSKHMRVITNKMMEYVNKTTNVELTGAVSAMPSSMRFMFADMKDLTGETTHKLYLDIGDGLGDTIGPILSSSLNVNSILDNAKRRGLNLRANLGLPLPNIPGITGQLNFNNGNISGFIDKNITFPIRRVIGRNAPPNTISGSGTKDDPWITPAIEGDGPLPSLEELRRRSELPIGASSGLQLPSSLSQPPTLEEFENNLINSADSDGIAKLNVEVNTPATTPVVPMCYAEEIAAKVIVANRKLIDDANNTVLNNMNSFIGDMQSMIGIQQEKTSNLIPGLQPGAIVSITDEEVLDQVRGGTNYITAQRVATTFFKSIKPGITTSPGSGALVDITVSSGGIAGFGNAEGAQDFTFISQGTNYNGAGGGNGTQNATEVDTDGDGTGMKLNMIISGGVIQTIFVHTIGTGYKVGDIIIPHIAGGGSSVAGNGSFKLDKIAGAIDPGGIKIVDRGNGYQNGDVLKVNGGGFDASFTVTASNDVVTPKTKDAAGNKLTSIDGLLSKLNGISGNLSKALKFKNIKSNVFPFEEPPNLAVSDYFILARGGASQAASELPSIESLANNVNLDQIIPEPEVPLPFLQPSNGQPNIIRTLENISERVEDTLENL